MNKEVEIYDGVSMIGNSNNGNFDWLVSGGEDQLPATSEIAQLVINSEPYQRAYAILSAEPDRSWLVRLEQIPYMVLDASSTWFDEHNWTNKAEDKQAANYQYCLENIASLMAEYQAWKNSLPSSQVDQQSVIGYNSAITGQNIGASSIPNVGVSANPSAFESTNSIEVFGSVISTASSLLSTISGGALSWVQLFNQVNQFDRSMIETTRMNDHTINKEQVATNLTLAEKGIATIADTAHSEVISSSSFAGAHSAEENAKEKEAILKDYTTFIPPAPLAGSAIKEVYDKIANLKFDLMLKRLKVESLKQDYEGKLHQFNSGYLTDDPKSFGASKSAFEMSQYEYDSYVKKRSLEFLKDMSEKSKEGSIVHSYMLDSILTGIDIKSLAALSVGQIIQPIADTISDKLGVDINL